MRGNLPTMRTLSAAQVRALHIAFEKGQQDWREGKNVSFYLPGSLYDHMWDQGWEMERSAHHD